MRERERGKDGEIERGDGGGQGEHISVIFDSFLKVTRHSYNEDGVCMTDVKPLNGSRSLSVVYTGFFFGRFCKRCIKTYEY